MDYILGDFLNSAFSISFGAVFGAVFGFGMAVFAVFLTILIIMWILGKFLLIVDPPKK